MKSGLRAPSILSYAFANHPVSLLPKALGPLVLLLFPIKTYFRPSLE